MNDPRKNRPSASGIERRFMCPGSAQAEAGIPETPDDGAGDVKDSGIAIHAALSGDPVALRGLSSEDLAVYEEMNRKADAIAREHGFDPEKFIAEARLWFGNEFSGQSDRTYINGVRSLVIDFKAGFLPTTTASENPQLATLAVLTIRNHCVARVTVAIIPRFGAVKEVAEYDLSSAQAALAHIRAIIANSEVDGAPRTPSDKACRYCRAKTRCPEFQSFTMAVTTVEKAALPALPADKLAALIDRISAVNGLIEALKAEGKRRLAAGDEEFSKLYELTAGRNVRTITDLHALFGRLAPLGVTDVDFTKECEISFGAVDKAGNGSGLKGLIHSATGLKGTALDKKLDALLDGIIEETKTAGSLKRKELK